MSIRHVAPLVLFAVLVPSLAQATEVKTSTGGMTYSIRVPGGYDPGQGAVLVFGLHGRGGSHTQFMPGLVGASYLRKHIVVAPNALANAQWAASDLPVLASLVKQLQATYNCNRTIFFGFSMGAYCSFGFSLSYPELVQAVIPHSGGMGVPVANSDAQKKLAYYVIHGDADNVVNVSQSRSAVKNLEARGISLVKYEELGGLAHTISRAACERAFAWVESTLGPARKSLPAKEVKPKLSAVDAALKGEDWATAREELEALAGAGPRYAKKIAGLAKRCVKTSDEALALTAIDAAGRLGEAGLSPLKAVPQENERLASAAATALARTRSPKAFKILLSYLKGDSEQVAVSAAKAVERLGGRAADQVLIKALRGAEKSEDRAERRDAILAALKGLHGQSLDSSRAWARWLAQNS
jgi:predicted esterase